MFLVGKKGTVAPARWYASRKGCTAVSTVEAEVVGINDATRSLAIPMVDLLSELGHVSAEHKVFTDAQAARSAVVKGTSKSLGHLRKVHRLSLAALHDIFTEHDDLDLEHIPGLRNVADVFTKALAGPRIQLLRAWMGVLPEGNVELPLDRPALALDGRAGPSV